MVDASEKPIVTLTGITGYIGSHTCLKFLEDGGFRVRGTVRDKTNEAKLAPIREAFGALYDQLELVEADLMDEQSLINAVAGSTYVVHMASPFFWSEDESKIITPAVNGTLFAMRACKAAGVKRIVITSSCVSIINMANADKPADGIFNESMWSNENRPEGMPMYFKSKILAERAAWDFQAKLSADEKFEVVTVLPAFVMGPPLRKENFSSGDWLKSVMLGTMKLIPSKHNCVVDVRDAAFAHLAAIKVPAAANRRFALTQGSPTFQEFAQPVVDKYGPLGWPVATNKQAADPNEVIDTIDNSASRDVLGVQYHDFTQTMLDMADKMVELGTVTKDSVATGEDHP